MDLTRAPSSTLPLFRDAGRKGGSRSVGADTRTNEEPATTRRQEDNTDKIIIRSASRGTRLTGSGRQRRRKDLTTTTATLVTMKRQTYKITEAVAVNDDDEPEMGQQQQQVQVFACRKRQPPRETASTNGRRAGFLALLGGVGGGDVWAATAALLALVMVLLSAASQTSEAIKLAPEGKEKYHWTGEQLVVQCLNTNNIKNVKFTWLGPNKQAITEDKSQRVHAEKQGPHAHRLVLMNATAPVDEGSYTCNLGSTDDRTPRETIDFNLKLYRSTSFRDTNDVVVLNAGREGEISCRVEFDSSVQVPTVKWYRDQKQIETFNDPSYNVSEYDQQTRLSRLTFLPVNKHHDGVYTCRAEAVTPGLTRTSDHQIKLVTHYAPIFDKPIESVWVAKKALGIRSGASSVNQQQDGLIYSSQPGGRPSPHQQVAARRNSKSHVYPNPSLRRQSEYQQLQQQQANSSEPLRIRVELNCTCQANPPATLVWSISGSNMELMVGSPPHVISKSETTVEGHNSSSTVVIDYVFSPEWPNKNDQYICSATNSIGSTTKTFTVEQGNPPPAFLLAEPKPQYYPQDSILRLAIGGPNFEPEAAQSSDSYDARLEQRQQQEGRPAVDSFRIRAEIASATPPTAGDHQKHHLAATGGGRHHSQQHHSQRSSSNFPLGPFAEWTLQPEEQQAIENNLRGFKANPVIFNVSLRNLPPGNQRLFLEAHNAVGWSPDSTYLGDFNVVSGATASFFASSGAAFHLQVVANLLMSFCIILGLAKVY